MKEKVFRGFLLLFLMSTSALGTSAFEVYTRTSIVTYKSGSTIPKDSLELSFDFSCPSVTPNLNYHNVTMSGLPSYGDPGEPILPFKLVRVLIPQNKDVGSISVCPDKMTRLTGKFNVDYGKTALPISANVSVQDKPNAAIYSSADLFPPQSYSQESEQYLRGYKIVQFRLNPIRYIPKTGELYYYPKLTLNLQLKDTNGQSPFFRGLPEDSELVSSLVENPIAVMKYDTVPSSMKSAVSSPTQAYDYIIVTNDLLNSSFQPLINWKISKGLNAKTVLVGDIMKEARYNSDGLFGDGTGSSKFNDTQAHIRNFIRDAYLNLGTQYVLLGADDDVIPSRGVYDWAGEYTDYNIPCDMYYGALDGSWDKDNDTIFGETVYRWNGPENATAGEEADFFAELYIGRATVDTPSEATNFVNKTITYEQSPQASYVNKALAVGQTLDDVTQGANGEDTVTDINPQYTTTRLYDRDGTYNAAAVKSELNSGPHIVNHGGHSNWRRVMDLLPVDIYALTNSQPFLVYSLGCFSAAFDAATSGTTEAVAEHFIRATHGAFAYIGNTRYGWYCPASYNGPGETYDRSFFSVLNSGTTNLGKALQISKEREPSFDRWTYFTLNLLGDPETEIVTSLKNPTAHFKTNTALLTPPRIGGVVNLTGTARRGMALGAAFSSYIIDFGSGVNPSSWITVGINLRNGGLSEVVKDVLATWNTTQIPESTYTLRLTVAGGGLTGTDRLVVTVNKQAAPFYIKVDGTVDPPTAPVVRNGDTYTLTADVFSDSNGIIIQKNSVTLNGAGHILQGNGSGIGIYLFERHNVTVKNIWVRSKLYGIYLENSSQNEISRSTTESCTFGIWLSSSSRNRVIANNVAKNYYGISFLYSSNANTIVENQIVNNTGSYAAGVYVYISSNNSFYHNIFIGNMVQRTSQVYDAAWDCADQGLTAPSINIWDNGYPSGGNYWSNYNGTDIHKGVHQNETGSDGIGDEPYIVDTNETIALNNTDRYPLLNALAHDITVINVTTSKTVVGKGFNVTVRAWIKNGGTFSEMFNVTIGVTRIIDEVIGSFANITLMKGEMTVISYVWNTTSWPIGNYTLTVFTSPVQGEIMTADNLWSDGIVSISIAGDITGMSGLPDGKVDMRDVGSVAILFGTNYPNPGYDPNFDVNDDGKLNMFDVAFVATHFGSHL